MKSKRGKLEAKISGTLALPNNSIRNFPLVTDFCTEVFSTISRSSIKGTKGSPTVSESSDSDTPKDGKVNIWIQVGICTVIIMIVVILVCIFAIPRIDLAVAKRITELNDTQWIKNQNFDDRNDEGNRPLNSLDNGEAALNSTVINSEVLIPFLEYLQGFAPSSDEVGNDLLNKQTETNEEVNSPSTEDGNVTEPIPDPEALRYLAYIPVVIDDEDLENSEELEPSTRWGQRRRFSQRPNRREPYPGSLLLAASHPKINLADRFDGIPRRPYPRQEVRPPPPSRLRVPVLPNRRPVGQRFRGFSTPEIRTLPPPELKKWRYDTPPNRKVQDQRILQRLNEDYKLHADQSQVNQFTSIQDIIHHTEGNERRRQQSERFGQTRLRPLSTDQRSFSRSESGKRYTFMLDLYPVGGGRSGGRVHSDESRLMEDRERDRQQNSFRVRSPGRPEDEEEKEDVVVQFNVFPKGRGKNNNERLKFTNYDNSRRRDDVEVEPSFTINDIIRLLSAAGLTSSASNKKSTVLPALPRDVLQSRDTSGADSKNEDKDMDAIESHQTNSLMPYGYYRNYGNRHGYVNIENHAPEPLPHPEPVLSEEQLYRS